MELIEGYGGDLGSMEGLWGRSRLQWGGDGQGLGVGRGCGVEGMRMGLG